MAFETSHERDFLVFGVSNAKYLAFYTPNENALIGHMKLKSPSSIRIRK